MKSKLIAFCAATAVAAIFPVAPAIAGAGHDHGPKHGGLVREVKDIAYELVAKPDSLTLHVSNHGKPVSTQGATAEAVIYAGSEKTAVKLEPAGEGLLQAKGKFRVGVGVRVVVSVTLAGKEPAKPSFNLK